jgi:hypothetical protein
LEDQKSSAETTSLTVASDLGYADQQVLLRIDHSKDISIVTIISVAALVA